MAVVGAPAARAFDLSPAGALTLPLAGVLYAGMTVDSALRGAQALPYWRS
jgi:hypothetical protein